MVVSIRIATFPLWNHVEFPIAVSAWADYAPRVFTEESKTRDGWNKAIRIIHTMFSLGDDWDGMGAKAPPPDIVFSALELAYHLCDSVGYPAPTRVSHSPAGTIGFEWQNPPVYTEVEIVGPNSFDWMQIQDGEKTKHWTQDQVREHSLANSVTNTLNRAVDVAQWPHFAGSPF
jgi:hypothetical protein